MTFLADIMVVLNDNSFLFKNNVKYTRAKFMQDSKMTKESIGMFFNNPNLAPIWEYLSYKNLNKMRGMLTKLPYSKVI